MDVRVRFFGGAQTVTGSKYLLEIDDFKLLVDCGLFQGLKALRLKNWQPLDIDPNQIDAVLLTHAHIDHSGYLPRLIEDGFEGPVYCTDATAALLRIMLTDSAKLQEEEARFANKKGYSKHANPQPLYSVKSAVKALEHLVRCSIDESVVITKGVEASFVLAGHILGAASIILRLKGAQQAKEIIFSGDLGRYNNPLHFDPTPIKTGDVLFIESTYGNRQNESDSPEKELARVINETIDRGGCLLIPAFSVGRTQLMLYYLAKLFDEGKIPRLPVYLDSPMALSVTGLYRRYDKCHRLSMGEEEGAKSPFDHPQFHYVQEQEQSMALNNIERNTIIVSASGMCTGGRVMHHLYHRLPRPNDTLLFVGYQGEGTRGRKIADGAEHVKMFGLEVPVMCHVEVIHGLSAHADLSELLRWAGNFISPPKMTFVVHGEQDSARHLAQTLAADYGHHPHVPELGEAVSLFRGI
jgi:metallo-beta-lactamase family protein